MENNGIRGSFICAKVSFSFQPCVKAAHTIHLHQLLVMSSSNLIRLVLVV
jgi:hypothetical protein